jgi:predicted oxidoreductase
VQVALDAVATRRGITRTQAALAHLQRHPSRIVPVIGTTDPHRMAECWASQTVPWEPLDWYEIHIAARGAPLP